MIGLDTNILIRWLTGDDSEPGQSSMAASAIETAAEDIYLNDIVLVETCWVLSSRYRHSRAAIADGMRRIVAQPTIRVERADAVDTALTAYEMGGAGFSDQLLGATNTAAGCRTTLTFDKGAGKGPHFTQLI